MEDNIWAAEFWRNTFEYWNKEEDAGYWGKWVRTLFEEGEWDKIETEQTVIDLLEIGEGIWERVQTYVEEKKFGEKWKKAVNEINGYKDEAVKIRNELEGSGKTPKEIIKIYSRSNELKSHITNSEAYTKYLKHIDLNYYRLKKAKLASKHDTPSEDEKNSACEEDSKLKELLKFIPSNRRELNELKKSYMDEITKVKNQRANDKDAFEKEKEEWLIQRGEIENEISELNNKLNDSSNKSLVISYDVYNILYKYIIGQSITIDTESWVYFSLNDKKWKILLKILCNFILPPINHYRIDYAPSSSESVRRFMINSLPIQKQFYFNYNNEEQLEASKYIEALKVAAKKTTDSFFCILH